MEKHTVEAKMTTGPVAGHLLRTAFPLVFGMLGYATLDIVDTYFLAHLGSDYVAAIGYLFPITSLVVAFMIAIEAGTASVVSRALGEGRTDQVKRYITDALLLAALLAVGLVLLIWLVLDPLLRFTNVPAELFDDIHDFIAVWVWFIPSLLVCMAGAAALRAVGYANIEGGVMMLAAVTNLVLDPIFIFGYLGLPEWGIKMPFEGFGFIGAAMASLAGQLLAFTVVMVCLLFRFKLCAPLTPSWQELKHSWLELVRVGIPAGGAHGTLALVGVVLIALLGFYGKDAVAGLILGARVEQIVVIGFFSLAAALAAYSGQNYGAGRLDRVKEGLRISMLICVSGSVLAAVLFWLGADWVVSAFVSDGEVKESAITYILVVSFSYGLLGLMMCVANAFNGMGKPIPGLILASIRAVLFVPIAWLGHLYFGLVGIFAALSITNVVSCIISYAYMTRWLNRKIAETGKIAPVNHAVA